ncbi:MAG: DNA repair exonuclease, partial [Oscillospiraceae bacterium]|nr:DNA repair exonuclease [Oscillospiraceae bacterium]
PLLRGFRVDDPSAVNLMVLHGDALQPNSPYNPISREEIAASGLSYLALGHVHAMDVQEAGGTTYAYPGCLMGRGFDETGQKGALLAELSEGDCKITVLPVASRRYEILSVEAGDDPLGMILSRLPAQTQRDCYRIILTGESDPIDTGALARDLEGRFFSLSLRDKTLPKQALWDACGEETLRGHFLQTLKEQYDHAQPEEQKLLAQAAHFGLALMDRREVQL